MSKWMPLTILASGVAMILGCPQQPSGTAAMVEDKTYGDPAVERDPYTEEGGERSEEHTSELQSPYFPYTTLFRSAERGVSSRTEGGLTARRRRCRNGCR